ncbi:tyrosine-type recombinase/integrase [Humisphaera borealis]|uniref:Tyrosine-type recombinase/integrase n=1 Tax=Humisphaera borealis TaxID=2807512 RepID=A0A7M2WWQ0_9BACT|nr:tyrosine-type recombinase/integrase [Humisphaera borealis]QOV89754.1 tyrosine-type recombinase/integrase [Humisphaera borealis]
MASVIKRKKSSKVWTGIYIDHTGRQVWKALYADKAESLRAVQRLEDAAKRIANGDIDPAAEERRRERAKSVQDHIRGFEASMISNARSAGHVSYSTRDVELFVAHAGVKHAAAVTRQHVDAWRTHCLDVGYLDPRRLKRKERDGDVPLIPSPDARRTVNRRVASVRAWLYWCQQAGVIDRNPLHRYGTLATAGHERRGRRRALSREELDKLLTATPDEHRRLVYRFAALTGFRRSEVASLTAASFDLKEATVTVGALHAKRKDADQTLPLHRELVGPVGALIKTVGKGQPLFAVPPKNDVVATLHADLRAAGVETAGIVFHSLRHTFCSLLAAKQIRPEVLKHLARHRDIKTTLGYYVHWRSSDERDAINAM